MKVDEQGLFIFLKIKNKAHQAMLKNIIETTAKQESIEFAEWIRNNDYEYAVYTDESKVYLDVKTQKSYTTEQLYTIFKNKKGK